MQEHENKEINEEMPKNNTKNTEDSETSWLSIFMCFGISLGSCIGGVMFDNMSMGMCIGMSLGIAIGSALDALNRKKKSGKTESSEDAASEEIWESR